ncbi:MAG: hypothetical protein LBU64_09800 [Planctomycetota bacterium]|nr:hypothetical protein [Planctomycetota bacterium]
MNAIADLTQKQKDELFDEYGAAMDRGDYEAAVAIGERLPIHPGLAGWAREKFTPEEIKESGFIMPDSLD